MEGHHDQARRLSDNQAPPLYFQSQSQTPPMSSSSYSASVFHTGSPAGLVDRYAKYPGPDPYLDAAPMQSFSRHHHHLQQQHPPSHRHHPHHQYRQPMPGTAFSEHDIRQSLEQNGTPVELRQHPGQHFQSSSFAGNPFDGQANGSKQGLGFDGAVFLVDPALQPAVAAHGRSVNPAAIMGRITPPEERVGPTSNMMRLSSPVAQQDRLLSSPRHSRHTSLDPASAGLVGPGPPSSSSLEWAGMTGHRRTPSEHSDLSSVTHSPFASQHDTFDAFEANHSPLLDASQDPGLFQDVFGIERFSISDAQRRRSISAGQSPYVSPRILPSRSPDALQETHQFILPPGGGGGGGPGPQLYGPQGYLPNDMGQADTMSPPEINVEFAPPARQQAMEDRAGDGDGNRNRNDADALSPPGRGRANRLRAKSDTSLRPLSRPVSPAEISPNLLPRDFGPRPRSLSPFDATFPAGYRDHSPASKSSRRSSTSSINPNRDYILELADPTRPAASGPGTRVQKHPATFQCTLCPKRFTRAYNLRSHLRTHTDERPFVCTVCGKAFARQHDRKRHEGLHSGEKKFVCRGELANGGAWGCGRRFARADALGRHFRSEAGRVCIKPLLDEEATERRRVFDDEQQHQHQLMTQGMQVGGMMSSPPQQQLQQMQRMDMGPFALPQALLAQYPALQALQWDQLGQPGPGDEGDMPVDGGGGGGGGRRSFDAGAEDVYFEDEEEEGYVSGPGTAYATPQWTETAGRGGAMSVGAGGGGWTSDYEGR